MTDVKNHNFGPNNPPRAALWDWDGSLAEHLFDRQLLPALEGANKLAGYEDRPLESGIMSNTTREAILRELKTGIHTPEEVQRLLATFSRGENSHIFTPETSGGDFKSTSTRMADVAFEVIGITDPSKVVILGNEKEDEEFALAAGAKFHLVSRNDGKSITEIYRELGLLK